ncbi:MAG: pseudouridine synthase [Gemmatimonadetes bacterium]|nr:pseudouridine synthase [Gemmatimonadota bacterium]
MQKYISQAGVASRRQAEGLMRAGRVVVNGKPATEMGVKVIPGRDTVLLDGRIVEPARRRWIVFHKPSGVLCTRADPHGGQTVYDLLPSWAAGLRYVGRLDRDTSGLLLLTNEGDTAAALAHPSGQVEREYLARVAGPVTARDLRALRRGVELEDGIARPRRVRKLPPDDERWGIVVVLTEGRKREVRRLLKAVGHPVLALARTRFGPFRLGGLAPGGWRPAHSGELEQARSITTGGRRNRRGSARRGAHA